MSIELSVIIVCGLWQETDWSTSNFQVTGNARFPNKENNFPAPPLGAIHKKTSHKMSLYYRTSMLPTFTPIYRLILEKNDDFHATPKILWLFGGHTGNHVVSAAVPPTPRSRCFFFQYPLGGVRKKISPSTSGGTFSRQKSQRGNAASAAARGVKDGGGKYLSSEWVHGSPFLWYSGKMDCLVIQNQDLHERS